MTPLSSRTLTRLRRPAVLRSQRQGIVTVLAADSGKIASALATYVRTGEIDAEYAKHQAKFEEIRKINRNHAKTDELFKVLSAMSGRARPSPGSRRRHPRRGTHGARSM